MPNNRPPTRAALHIVFFILLLEVIGISLLYPVAPYLVRRYSSSALLLTILAAAYAAGQFFAAPAC